MKQNAIVACTSKKKYKTREEAEDMVNYLWAEKGVLLNVYRCPICEGFHLSSR